MCKRKPPTPEMLRRLLRYDTETGKLYWRKRNVCFFNATAARTAEDTCRRWNTRYAGKEAIATNSGEGYLQGSIFNRIYRSHRVIWAMETGAWPVDQLDHIDGDPSNNRIENIREVTNTENARNTKRPKNNTSGFVGVYWDKRAEKWNAQIKVDGAMKNLGYFTKKSDAIAARAASETEYGFHPNHGRVVSGADS